MQRSISEEDALKSVKEKCALLSKSGIKLEFLGWNGEFRGLNYTRVKLRSSEFGYWDDAILASILRDNYVGRPSTLSKEYVERKTIQICSEISTDKEVISFLGFVNGEFNGIDSRLILHNSKLNSTWDTFTFRHFSNNKPRHPKLTEEEAINRVKIKCKELNEDLEFLGFQGGSWKGNTTKLILKNKDKVWDTTNYNSFVTHGLASCKPKENLDGVEMENRVRDLCKERSTSGETLEFLGWKGVFKGYNTKLRLKSSEYGYWEDSSLRNFINNPNKIKPKKQLKEFVESKILKICKEISTLDETIRFLGFAEEFIGITTRIILYNSRLDCSWNSTRCSDFFRYKTKTPKLTEEIAKERIIKKCNEISTDEETISFLGFAEDWKGKRTYLRLHNSKTNQTWESTYYDSFMSQGIKHPFVRRTKEYYDDKIKEICIEVSTKEETLVFLGWKDNLFVNDRSKITLRNTKYGIEWSTTSCNNFLRDKNKLPNRSEGRRLLSDDLFFKAYPSNRKSLEDFISDYYEKFPNGYDLSNVNYTNSREKICVICHEKDEFGNQHGEFWISPSNLMQGYGCPKCNRSLGEELIGKYLDLNQIKYCFQQSINQEVVSDCPNKERLLIDYFLELNGRKIFLEYNGKQHYEYTGFFHDSLQNYHRQLFRDLSLRRYAQENGIELLEIPYVDLDRIPEILDAFLEEGRDITTKVPRDLLSGPKQLLLPTP